MLDPEPRAVGHARRWVGEALAELGRDDLVDAAELGVSELVTNAILHADPPITVRVRGTAQHPRVEVHDASTRPPELNTEMAEEKQLLRTIGRGLGLLALYSATWGADVAPDGKTIWFEPAEEPDPELTAEGSVFDLSEVIAADLPPAPADADLLRVRLLGMPPLLWAHFRAWYAEIRRELRILALAHPDEYPVAQALFDVTVQVDRDRTHAHGVERLDAAILEGLTRVDLDYLVPPTAPATMRRMGEVMEQVNRFCAEHELLALPESALQARLRRWYVDEFTRQEAGQEPQPWTGPLTADEPGTPGT